MSSKRVIPWRDVLGALWALEQDFGPGVASIHMNPSAAAGMLKIDVTLALTNGTEMIEYQPFTTLIHLDRVEVSNAAWTAATALYSMMDREAQGLTQVWPAGFPRRTQLL